MRDFLRLVYGEGEGWACITIRDAQGNPTIDRYFKYPTDFEKMVTYAERNSHKDVYFTPALMNDKARRKPNPQWVQVAYADADLCPVEDLLLEPSIIVQTSKDKTHVYWIIMDETDPEQVEKLSHAVSLEHTKSATNLDHGWASNKLLRVPGSTNLKYTQSWDITYEVTGLVYTVEEFKAKYSKEVAESSHEYRGLPSKFPSRTEALASITWTTALSDLLDKDKTFQPNSGRYLALHLATNELFRAGASDEEAFVLLEDTDMNKWRTDGVHNWKQSLWDDIQRTRAQEDTFEPDNTVPISVQSSQERNLNHDFLTDEERKLIEPTFVDRFVQWSSERTNTSKNYQVAGAFSILSTVFSDFGCFEMKYGIERLNLWFVMSGKSTIDRKTTVLNHMMGILKGLEDEEFLYDVGSDFTTAALSDILLDKPERSGLVQIDEFQGFLKELERNYMQGAKEQLTAMYSGTIKGKLRATADKKRRGSVKYSLSFWGTGITDQIAEQLTRADFESGFLTRFLFVTPDDDFKPGKVTDGFELANAEESKHIAEVEMSLIQEVQRARDYWYDFLDSLNSPPELLKIDQAVNARIVKLIDEIVLIAQKENKPELISTAQRLGVSIYKCACLLSMVEGAQRVEMKHVVMAINYGQSWITNMFRMVDRVASTDWARKQSHVVTELVNNNGTMTYTALFRKFRAEYTVKDFGTLLDTLISSGVIALVPDGKGKAKRINLIGGIDDEQ